MSKNIVTPHIPRTEMQCVENRKYCPLCFNNVQTIYQWYEVPAKLLRYGVLTMHLASARQGCDVRTLCYRYSNVIQLWMREHCIVGMSMRCNVVPM